MSAREHMVSDAARHLGADIQAVFERHLRLMQAGGMSTAEGAAAIMRAAENFAFLAIGTLLIAESGVRRRESAAAAIFKLTANLADRVPELVGAVADSERAARR